MSFLEKLANQNYYPSLMEILPIKAKDLNSEKMKIVFYPLYKTKKIEVVGKKINE